MNQRIQGSDTGKYLFVKLHLVWVTGFSLMYGLSTTSTSRWPGVRSDQFVHKANKKK